MESCCQSTWKVKWKRKSLNNIWLCNSMDYTVYGILQARILEWVAFPFSRGSFQPRDQTQVSHIAGRFFTSWAIKKLQTQWISLFSYRLWDSETLRLWVSGSTGVKNHTLTSAFPVSAFYPCQLYWKTPNTLAGQQIDLFTRPGTFSLQNGDSLSPSGRARPPNLDKLLLIPFQMTGCLSKRFK